MRIGLAQIDSTVGAFAANAARVRDAVGRAAAAGCDLVAFPELTLSGYPPRDFLDVPEFVARQTRALDELARAPELRGRRVVVGFAEPHGGEGAGLYNACALVGDGAVQAVGRKTLLPTYDVFDEARYFDPAPEVTVTEVAGVPIGLSICEDIWNDKRFWTRRRYGRDPIEEMVRRGARVVLNISASPFARGKPALRERMLGAAAAHHGVPVAYVNLVGGNDALVFDGHSAVFDAAGAVVARARGFAEELLVWDTEVGGALAEHADDLDELMEALVLGTRDYARKTGFARAVLGLSGGIDSSLTAVIAARAFGPERVLGVAMPSRYTADMSTADAAQLAAALGIEFRVVEIEPLFRSFLDALAPVFAGLPADVTEENLQARVRGTLLMALSNKQGRLVLSTGNKSELGVGYCTLYGDMAGGLAVIGDVPKTTVYALSRRINRGREVIPARVLERPPSAELRPDQTDQDSLPPYDVLDRVLDGYVEERLGPAALAGRGIDRGLIERVLGMVLCSEYKRRQAAPVIRVSARAFGEGWRFPIAHGFRYGEG